jgi:hypothetical protein
MDLMKNSLLKSNIWTTFAILATLNVLDAASTAILVHKFGSGVEANPIVRYWIEAYGVTGIYMIKFLVVAFLGLTIIHIVNYYSENIRAQKVAHTCMWILNAMLLFIVINNVILVINTINT